jgi:antitoxin CptB
MTEDPSIDETPQNRLKRLRMRSMRRGIREMDLILTAFATAELDGLTEADLLVYDLLLEENDQDLYAWVTGRTNTPEPYQSLVARIAAALHRN